MGAPRCFFKEGNTIPKIKERNQTDKVKGKKKSGKPAQASARRVMTAKLKKELAQRKRGGGSSAAEIPRSSFTDTASTTATGSASADSSTGAVEQVEQTTQAAAADVGRAAKRGAAMAVSKVKQKRREVKERRRQPDAQGQPPDIGSPASGGHRTEIPPGQPSRQDPAGDAFTSTPPTPGECMRQRAADQRKEQLTRPRAGTPSQGTAPASPHYGGPQLSPGPSTKNSPTGDRSIYPSIHQRAPPVLQHTKGETYGRGHPAQDPTSGGTGRPDTGGPCQRPRSRWEEGRRQRDR